MGLDIGFVRSIDWAPRTGWDFGLELSDELDDFDGGTRSLTLEQIESCYESFTEYSDKNRNDKEAARFMSWTRYFWWTNKYSSDEALGVEIDS